MISWAGHGEDQILRRVLIDRTAGTYIDIGAAHPKFGSVTYALYELGWRGIAIEPREELAKTWSKKRPEDLLISSALTTEGLDGWITSQGFRSRFTQEIEATPGVKYSRSKAVSTAKLFTITKNHLNSAPTFIKVDIEGGEYKIVTSMLSLGFHPEIWIIEVVDQYNSEHIRRTPSLLLEAFLSKFNYQMVLFDGVNEWYVINSSKALHRNIWAPAYPGVEDFIPFHLTVNYRVRNFLHSKRERMLKKAKVFIKLENRK